MLKRLVWNCEGYTLSFIIVLQNFVESSKPVSL